MQPDPFNFSGYNLYDDNANELTRVFDGADYGFAPASLATRHIPIVQGQHTFPMDNSLATGYPNTGSTTAATMDFDFVQPDDYLMAADNGSSALSAAVDLRADTNVAPLPNSNVGSHPTSRAQSRTGPKAPMAYSTSLLKLLRIIVFTMTDRTWKQALCLLFKL
ncbi:hypothetical protein BDB00DRAFT_906260 [Zychaea mexicana]|uniref:uncharacterized protein n=1 Tax=Zychaea mexicana TaxID=64656 RepID=UPI0022FF1CC0|nr:uncharacterized protein BDB00DRAFT_906260 [Zychaea mexicana]KAI9466376.1 hypothetical protein BDB00DRAFT_906260 [Zychaea mexicana]